MSDLDFYFRHPPNEDRSIERETFTVLCVWKLEGEKKKNSIAPNKERDLIVEKMEETFDPEYQELINGGLLKMWGIQSLPVENLEALEELLEDLNQGSEVAFDLTRESVVSYTNDEKQDFEPWRSMRPGSTPYQKQKMKELCRAVGVDRDE